MECGEYGRREFLSNLCQCLGIEAVRKYSTSDDSIIQAIADFFNQRAAIRPLLILDEADKLKPTAIRVLIPLYNKCEDRLGLLVCGCDNLETEFQRGVRYNKKGYDEMSSRFGRKFIHLPGCTEGDISRLCQANGISSTKQQKAVFEESEPINTFVGNQAIKVIHDLRRVRRIIERKLRENTKQLEAVAA